MGRLHDMAGGGAAVEDEVLDIDFFTDQFKRKTQYSEFYEPKPEAEKTDDIPSDLINPDGEPVADEQPAEGTWSPDGEETKPINPERFAKTGKNIARLVDTGFDFAASNFIAKGSGKSYHASDKDLEDIGEAWAEIAEEKQWDLGPVPRLILLYVIVYGPLAKQAFEDRRILELERRADETEQRQQEMADEIKYLKNELYRKTSGNATNNTAGVGAEASGAKA